MGGRRFKSHVGGFACKKGAACKRRVNGGKRRVYTSLTPAQGKGHALTNLFASCSTGARPPPIRIHTQIRIAPLRSPHVTGDDGKHAQVDQPSCFERAASERRPALRMLSPDLPRSSKLEIEGSPTDLGPGRPFSLP